MLLLHWHLRRTWRLSWSVVGCCNFCWCALRYLCYSVFQGPLLRLSSFLSFGPFSLFLKIGYTDFLKDLTIALTLIFFVIVLYLALNNWVSQILSTWALKIIVCQLLRMFIMVWLGCCSCCKLLRRAHSTWLYSHVIFIILFFTLLVLLLLHTVFIGSHMEGIIVALRSLCENELFTTTFRWPIGGYLDWACRYTILTRCWLLLIASIRLGHNNILHTLSLLITRLDPITWRDLRSMCGL